MKSASSRSARQPAASVTSSSATSETDWERLATPDDDGIQLSADHPESDPNHLRNPKVRRGLKPLPTQESVKLSIDSDVIEWYKAQGPDFGHKINAVLRAFRDATVQ